MRTARQDSRRALPAALLAAVLSVLALIAPAPAAANVGQTIILRCTHGESLSGFSQSAYSQALSELSATSEEYTGCAALIRQAQLAAAGGGQAGAAQAAGVPTLLAASPLEQRAIARAAHAGAAPVHGRRRRDPPGCGAGEHLLGDQLAAHPAARSRRAADRIHRSDRSGRPAGSCPRSPKRLSAPRSRPGSRRTRLRRHRGRRRAGCGRCGSLGGLILAIACAITFFAKGGLNLRTMTFTEMALTLGSGAIIAWAVLLAPAGGRRDGAWPMALLLALTALTARLGLVVGGAGRIVAGRGTHARLQRRLRGVDRAREAGSCTLAGAPRRARARLGRRLRIRAADEDLPGPAGPGGRLRAHRGTLRILELGRAHRRDGRDLLHLARRAPRRPRAAEGALLSGARAAAAHADPRLFPRFPRGARGGTRAVVRARPAAAAGCRAADHRRVRCGRRRRLGFRDALAER